MCVGCSLCFLTPTIIRVLVQTDFTAAEEELPAAAALLLLLLLHVLLLHICMYCFRTTEVADGWASLRCTYCCCYYRCTARLLLHYYQQRPATLAVYCYRYTPGTMYQYVPMHDSMYLCMTHVSTGKRGAGGVQPLREVNSILYYSILHYISSHYISSYKGGFAVAS